jgi:hypothetical protein
MDYIMLKLLRGITSFAVRGKSPTHNNNYKSKISMFLLYNRLNLFSSFYHLSIVYLSMICSFPHPFHSLHFSPAQHKSGLLVWINRSLNPHIT